MAAGTDLPVVDLAPFFTEDNSGGVTRATEAVREACRTHGCFRAVNHGVPAELMARALELSAAFFALPDDEKARAQPAEGTVAPLLVGYARQPVYSADKHEYVLVFDPKLRFNEYPAEPAGFSQTHRSLHVGDALLSGDGGGEQRPQRARGRQLHHLRHPGRRRGPRGPQGRRLGPGGARRRQHHRQHRRRHTGAEQQQVEEPDAPGGEEAAGAQALVRVLFQHPRRQVDRAAAGVHDEDRRVAALQGIRVQRVHADADEGQDPSTVQARGRRPQQHHPLCHLAWGIGFDRRNV